MRFLFPPYDNDPEADDGVTYLFRDEFTTAEAAPLTSPRTCEPGPGSLVFIDTMNWQSIVDGHLYDVGGNAPADPGLHSAASYARAAGLALFFRIDGTDYRSSQYGFDNSDEGLAREGFKFNSTTEVRAVIDGTTHPISFYSIANFPENFIVVCRSIGTFLIHGTTLVWVQNTVSIDPLWISADNVLNANNRKLDYVRLAQTAAPWDTVNDLATDANTGNVPVSTTMTHEADSFFEFTVTTLPSAGSISRHFRKQDANNFWAVTVTNAGGFELWEYVSGWQNRGAAAGVVSNGDRICIAVEGETIRGFVGIFTRWTYALAANFKTETAGELDSLGTGGAVQDDIVWPRDLSGSAAMAELEKYTV
jgi:hypothetical protein